MFKAIRVKPATYDWIRSQGRYGESMDDIIVRLLGRKKQNKEVPA